jgi:hypothetical protein
LENKKILFASSRFNLPFIPFLTIATLYVAMVNIGTESVLLWLKWDRKLFLQDQFYSMDMILHILWGLGLLHMDENAITND